MTQTDNVKSVWEY